MLLQIHIKGQKVKPLFTCENEAAAPHSTFALSSALAISVPVIGAPRWILDITCVGSFIAYQPIFALTVAMSLPEPAVTVRIARSSFSAHISSCSSQRFSNTDTISLFNLFWLIISLLSSTAASPDITYSNR